MIRKFLTVERARTFQDSDLPLPASLNGFAAKWNMIALVRLSKRSFTTAWVCRFWQANECAGAKVPSDEKTGVEDDEPKLLLREEKL